jgi:hypothetical protein
LIDDYLTLFSSNYLIIHDLLFLNNIEHQAAI